MNFGSDRSRFTDIAFTGKRQVVCVCLSVCVLVCIFSVCEMSYILFHESQ